MRISRRIGRRATLLLLAVPWSAMAAPQIYDTQRVLPHRNIECAGVPACMVASTPEAVLGPNQHQQVAVTCPKTHPVSWHWDTTQHEHLAVKLIDRTRTALTFSVTNLVDVPGRFRIFVGCSNKEFSFKGTGFMRSRTGVPSKDRTFQGESP